MSVEPSVTLRYWAAARDAAGRAQESFAGVATLAELLVRAAEAHPGDGRLARVLGMCAFLVDGDPVGLRTPDSVPLPAGAVVEALPPFAGG